MADGLKAGDLVQLNSGGPTMTVDEVEPWDGYIRATCSWFEGNKKMFDYFRVTSLSRAEKPGPAIAIGRMPGKWG